MSTKIPYLVESLKQARDEVITLSELKKSLCEEIVNELGVKEAGEVLTQANICFQVKLTLVSGQVITKIIPS